MSEKKDLSRSDHVRLRRESRYRQSGCSVPARMRRVPRRRSPRATRQAVAAPKRKPAQNARRRFQVALIALPCRMPTRRISIPRPRLGMRLLSFLVVAAARRCTLFCCSPCPTFRVTQAQVTGNQSDLRQRN